MSSGPRLFIKLGNQVLACCPQGLPPTIKFAVHLESGRKLLGFPKLFLPIKVYLWFSCECLGSEKVIEIHVKIFFICMLL